MGHVNFRHWASSWSDTTSKAARLLSKRLLVEVTTVHVIGFKHSKQKISGAFVWSTKCQTKTHVSATATKQNNSTHNELGVSISHLFFSSSSHVHMHRRW